MGSKVAVIGTGYVGLTTGACFAHIGHEVICADVDVDKVERLNRGQIPILEKGIDEIVASCLKEGTLRFVVGAANAVADAEFVYLCVPTPQADDGSADLSYIQSAAEEIGPHLRSDAIVVNKSTVPVGSTHVVERALKRPEIHVVSNPEFMREGSAVQDFLHPDRVVIGADDKGAAIRVASLFLGISAPIIVTDPASAETIKYASNAFLAAKVSFINAVAAVCEAVGANISDVSLGMGYDKRIGSEFLNPGPGWGGSCFPKDSRALVHIAESAGYDFDLMRGVITVNDRQLHRVVNKVLHACGGDVRDKRIAVWGLTFKANTDDIRDSPAIAIAKRLVTLGAEIVAYDPGIRTQVAGIIQGADMYSVCQDAHALVLLTEWDEFRWADVDKIGELLAARNVVDARNLLDRNAFVRRGFSYQGIGRA